MDSLPFELKVDIFRRVGHNGFTNLGPLLSSGREGRDAVFTPEVLREVALDEFMFFGVLALEGSIYRPFLVKCIENGNPDAKYIEAVRIFKQEGNSPLAFTYLNAAMPTNNYACFALSMFLFCTGDWENAFGVMSQFWDRIPTLAGAIEVGDILVSQIGTMGLPSVALYDETREYPQVPWCVNITCNMQDVCKDCMFFWYSRLISLMC